MRRFICILLVLLLLAGLMGCQAVPAPQESFLDLPIVTLEQKDDTGGLTSTAASTPADTAPVPTAESAAPVTEDSAPVTQATFQTEQAPLQSEPTQAVTEEGLYDSKEDVALYIHLYGHLPANYITKKEAENLGWSGGSLEAYAPGKCIGGSRFGNYEGLLPTAEGRTWTECDIDTLGARSRGSKRIVFSNDGLIYYTKDHYEHFELLYEKED